MLVSICRKKLLTYLVTSRSLLSVPLIARRLKKTAWTSAKTIQLASLLVDLSMQVVCIIVPAMMVALTDAETVPAPSVLVMITSQTQTT